MFHWYPSLCRQIHRNSKLIIKISCHLPKAQRMIRKNLCDKSFDILIFTSKQGTSSRKKNTQDMLQGITKLKCDKFENSLTIINGILRTGCPNRQVVLLDIIIIFSLQCKAGYQLQPIFLKLDNKLQGKLGSSNCCSETYVY